MTEHERVIARLRAAIGNVLGLRLALALLSGWLLLWGAAVLLLRGVLLVGREELLWGLLGVLAVAVIGVTMAIRRRPSANVVRAMLDGRGKCGGLLMASAATEIGAWQHKLPPPAEPTVRWRWRRQVVILLASTAFLAAGFLMPDRYIAPDPLHLQVGARDRKAGREDRSPERRKDSRARTKPRALNRRLEQVQKEASGDDPAKTWEAIDHLETSVAKAASDAADTAARDAQQAAKSQELAEAVEQAQDQMGADELKEAVAGLAKKVQQAAEEEQGLMSKHRSKELAEQLAKQLQSLARDKSLTKQQLKDLADALKQCKSSDLATLRRLAELRMMDPSRLSDLQRELEIDPDALAKMLAKCKGGKPGGKDGKDGDGLGVSETLARWNSDSKMRRGNGGPGGGGGPSPISWTNDANKDNVIFKEKVLPPGTIASLEDSRLQGVSLGGDPTKAQHGDSAAGGALDSSLAGHGAARTQVILPEHKGAVKRYFERGSTGGTPTNNKDNPATKGKS